MMRLLLLTSGLFCLAALAAAGPETRLDPVIRLYICQTEYELARIHEWETSDPPRYREAVKNGDITPVDAAREAAGFLVATDRIRCGAEGKVEIETPGKNSASASISALNDGDLERHCPLTMKKYGHPCR
jgi:hypothetical protein